MKILVCLLALPFVAAETVKLLNAQVKAWSVAEKVSPNNPARSYAVFDTALTGAVVADCDKAEASFTSDFANRFTLSTTTAFAPEATKSYCKCATLRTTDTPAKTYMSDVASVPQGGADVAGVSVLQAYMVYDVCTTMNGGVATTCDKCKPTTTTVAPDASKTNTTDANKAAGGVTTSAPTNTTGGAPARLFGYAAPAIGTATVVYQLLTLF